MRLISRTGLVAVLLAGLAILAPQAASAHTASTYYKAPKWPTGASISYGLNSGWPDGYFDYDDRILNAKNQWYQYAGSAEPKAYWTLNDYVSYGSAAFPCQMTSGTNTVVVFWMDLDGFSTGYLGATWSCADPNNSARRIRASIAIDNDRSWYIGTGDAPSNQPDLWAVASHEWGHAFGAAHFAEGESGVCPQYENTVRHVMCPSIALGYEVQRHPKTHDIHTFQAAW